MFRLQAASTLFVSVGNYQPAADQLPKQPPVQYATAVAEVWQFNFDIFAAISHAFQFTLFKLRCRVLCRTITRRAHADRVRIDACNPTCCPISINK